MQNNKNNRTITRKNKRIGGKNKWIKLIFKTVLQKVSAETFNLFQENIEKAIQAMIQAENQSVI